MEFDRWNAIFWEMLCLKIDLDKAIETKFKK